MKAQKLSAHSGGGGVATALWWLVKAVARLLWHLSKPLSLWLGERIHYLKQEYPGSFYSLLLHMFLLALLTINLSWFSPKPEVIHAITVELLPVGDKANIKPEPEKKPVEAKEKEIKKPAKPKRPAPPKPPKPEPKPIPPPPKPKPELPKPKPEKKPQPAPEKKEEKKPEPTTPQPLLKTLEKPEAGEKSEPPKPKTPLSEYNPELPLSITEIQSIQSQLHACWNVPAGARGVEDMKIQVHISLRQDGTVSRVELSDLSRYKSDSFYRAVADSATRAVHSCSPLKGLPVIKYNTWKEIEFVFDPSAMIY